MKKTSEKKGASEEKEALGVTNNEALEIQKPELEKNEALEIQKPELEKIAIILKPYVQVKKYGPQAAASLYKSYARGEIVFNQETLKELMEENAPIKVYVEYVD